MVSLRKGGRHGLQRSGHRLRPDTEQGKPLAMTSAGIVVKIEFPPPPSETRPFKPFLLGLWRSYLVIYAYLGVWWGRGSAKIHPKIGYFLPINKRRMFLQYHMFQKWTPVPISVLPGFRRGLNTTATPYNWNLERGHPLKLERYRED